jgi:lipoprotein-anchoring transpeptidase ErfK/SrfK
MPMPLGRGWGAGAPGRRRIWRLTGLVALVVSLAVVVSSQAWSDPKSQANGQVTTWVGGPSTGPDTPGGQTGASASPSAGPPSLAVVPVSGDNGFSVLDPVIVTAVSARLDTVTVVDSRGAAVPGQFDAAHQVWRSTQALAYNTAYTVTAAAVGSDGQRLQHSSGFHTVRPANLTMAYLRANVGLALSARDTYGVGQPIVVNFDEKITDRAAAQQALQVVTSPPVEGAWHWFSDQELHWRPKEYWPSGTKVTVTAAIYGKTFGNGLYGQANSSASFTIGPSRIAIADDKTFHMQVWQDGKMIRDIPVAMGLHESIRSNNGMWIDLRTHEGVHVVLDHAQVTRMKSSSFGLTGPGAYDEDVYWTTHISYSGEYVHAAPWSVGQQGHSDASHGCVNVNEQNAIWFYNTFIPGDIVDIRNTGLKLDATDGLGDWTLGWDAWVRGSAIPYVPGGGAAG